MAITPRDLGSGPSVENPLQRVFPKDLQAKTFAANGAAATLDLPPLTPVAYNTSTNLWVPWVNGGANGAGTILGFVWPHTITLYATGGGETIGSVMLAGELHYEDIDLSAGGGTSSQLIAQLQVNNPSLRSINLDIRGLNKIR